MVYQTVSSEMNSNTDLAKTGKSDLRVLQVGISGKTEHRKGPFLVVVYQTHRKSAETKNDGKVAVFRCRHIPVFINPEVGGSDGEQKEVWLSRTSHRLETHPRHSVLVRQVPTTQLQRILSHMYDMVISKTNNPADSDKIPLDSSSAERARLKLPKFSKVEETDTLLSEMGDDDLNKLPDEELAERKAKMDVLFNKNRITPDSPNFVYDLRMDFDATGAAEEKVAIWDDDT